MGNYQDLIFDQKARQVVKEVNALIKNGPQTIGANIAEGHGRHQGTEYVHYLIIAQSSSNETEHRLHTAQDCELETSETIEQILKINNEIIRMITRTIATIREKQGSRNIKEEATGYLTDSDTVNND